jgi:hypothetical protein
LDYIDNLYIKSALSSFYGEYFMIKVSRILRGSVFPEEFSNSIKGTSRIYGWLLPEGSFLKAGRECHGYIACEQFNITNVGQAYERAFAEGWIRIANASVWVPKWNTALLHRTQAYLQNIGGLPYQLYLEDGNISTLVGDAYEMEPAELFVLNKFSDLRQYQTVSAGRALSRSDARVANLSKRIYYDQTAEVYEVTPPSPIKGN